MLNKIASKYLEKVAENLPATMPNSYYQQRFREQPSVNNYTGQRAELVENLQGDMDVPNNAYAAMDPELPPNQQNVNSVRQRQAEQSSFNMGFEPGTKKYNDAVKFFIDNGRVNQHNWLYKNKKAAPAVPKGFTPDQQKVMKDWGKSISSVNKGTASIV